MHPNTSISGIQITNLKSSFYRQILNDKMLPLYKRLFLKPNTSADSHKNLRLKSANTPNKCLNSANKIPDCSMAQTNKSATYLNLIDLYFKLSQMAEESTLYSSTFNGSTFKRDKTNVKSQRIRQPIVMAENSFLKECSDKEWTLIRYIMIELKEYNCLWQCSDDIKKSSSNRAAIKSLIEKNILWKTETTHIYVVNPFYIRRGDPISVVATTAKLLENASRVDATYITNKKPIDDYSPTTKTPLIGYGYVADE